MKKISSNGLVLWTNFNNSDFYIILKMSNDLFVDGELELTLKHRDQEIYSIAFVFIPANILHIKNTDSILITRVQSVLKNISTFKKAINFFHGVGTQHILFSAFRGLAKYFKQKFIFCVSSENQSYYSEEKKVNYLINYNNFWVSLTGINSSPHFFKIKLPYRYKKIIDIKMKYRSRTKKKRNYKNEIMTSVFKKLEK
jgi:uncharacterized protein VirK/YbjX